MIGKRFGKWVVLEETSKKNISRQKYYLCQCDCGDQIEVIGSSLRSGKSSSCQKCCRQKISIQVGSVSGRWTILNRSEKISKFGHLYFSCKCECGSISDIRADALRKNSSTQCFNCADVIKIIPCSDCGCFNHRDIDLEESECDLLGFCYRCDKFSVRKFLAFEYPYPLELH